MSEQRRSWKPLPEAAIIRIRDDTELDNPRGDHCDAEVYALACEVLELRRKVTKELRHACLAALGYFGGVSICTQEQIVKTLRDAVRPTLNME